MKKNNNKYIDLIKNCIFIYEKLHNSMNRTENFVCETVN